MFHNKLQHYGYLTWVVGHFKYPQTSPCDYWEICPCVLVTHDYLQLGVDPFYTTLVSKLSCDDIIAYLYHADILYRSLQIQ